MADLPELSDSTKRKLALRWSILLDTNGLTGEHLHWHERERDRLQRIAAQSPRPVRDWRTERETDETGIPSSVTVAKGRFNDLMEEYWRLWLSSGDRYESLVGWLEVLRQQGFSGGYFDMGRTDRKALAVGIRERAGRRSRRLLPRW